FIPRVILLSLINGVLPISSNTLLWAFISSFIKREFVLKCFQFQTEYFNGTKVRNYFYYSLIPSISNKKAKSIATSLRDSKRPEAPPCTASILVCSKSRFESVFKSLSFATHFAGSQYCTWLSCRPGVTNIFG